MTKKDFASIARAISALSGNADRVHLATQIGKVCASRNLLFSQEAFDIACHAKRPV